MGTKGDQLYPIKRRHWLIRAPYLYLIEVCLRAIAILGWTLRCCINRQRVALNQSLRPLCPPPSAPPVWPIIHLPSHKMLQRGAASVLHPSGRIASALLPPLLTIRLIHIPPPATVFPTQYIFHLLPLHVIAIIHPMCKGRNIRTGAACIRVLAFGEVVRWFGARDCEDSGVIRADFLQSVSGGK